MAAKKTNVYKDSHQPGGYFPKICVEFIFSKVLKKPRHAPTCFQAHPAEGGPHKHEAY